MIIRNSNFKHPQYLSLSLFLPSLAKISSFNGSGLDNIFSHLINPFSPSTRCSPQLPF